MIPERPDQDFDMCDGTILNTANEAAVGIEGSRLGKRVESALKTKCSAVAIRQVKRNGRN